MLRMLAVVVALSLPAVAAPPFDVRAELAGGTAVLSADPPPTLGQKVLDVVFSPTGLSLGIGGLMSVIGLFVTTNEIRRRRVALAAHQAFMITEQWASELVDSTGKPPESLAKVTTALRAVDEYCTTHGWRPLSDTEKAQAELQFKATAGAQKAQAAVLVDALQVAKPVAVVGPNP